MFINPRSNLRQTNLRDISAPASKPCIYLAFYAYAESFALARRISRDQQVDSGTDSGADLKKNVIPGLSGADHGPAPWQRDRRDSFELEVNIRVYIFF